MVFYHLLLFFFATKALDFFFPFLKKYLIIFDTRKEEKIVKVFLFKKITGSGSFFFSQVCVCVELRKKKNELLDSFFFLVFPYSLFPGFSRVKIFFYSGQKNFSSLPLLFFFFLKKKMGDKWCG